jgi:sigma-E factor negative regulatory protein RseB
MTLPRIMRWASMLACLASAFGSHIALAQTTGLQLPGAPTDSAAVAKDARAWLSRIQDAPSRRNFQGTFVVTAGGAVSSARITHYQVGANQFERIDSLDGQTRHVFRQNDVVHTLWPQNRVVLVEQRDRFNAFPALMQAGDERIAELYELKIEGPDRVAGHEVNVLHMLPRDPHRFAYRLWADKDSGLLLRADVIGDKGELLESSAFSEVTIGVKPNVDSVIQGMKRPDGYRVVKPNLVQTQLEQEGWLQRQTVPGFRRLSCIKRPLNAVIEGGAPTAEPQVLQTIFTDGLTYVSVFIEPYSVHRHTRPMLTSLGATHTLMLRQGDWWFTVVGDVPPRALKAFAKGIERAAR